MEYNKQLENFYNNQSRWASTIDRIRDSKKTNSQFTLKEALNDLFESTMRPSAVDIGEILRAHSSEVMASIQNEALGNFSQDDFYVYPFMGYSSFFAQRIVIESNEHYTLSIDTIDHKLLSMYKRESKSDIENRGISFQGKETLMYFLASGELEVSDWRYDTPLADLTNTHCKHMGNRVLEDGVVVHKMPNETLMFESAKSNSVTMTVELKNSMSPYSLMFSAHDHSLKFQNPSTETDSRIQLSMSVLRKLDYLDAIPTIKKYLEHPHHFIRWYAMQQLLGLDALQVMDELYDMANSDPHEHVRVAAQKTLELIRNTEIRDAS